LESPDRDETVAWQAATAIMILVTLVTVAVRVLGVDPFTDIFDFFIVYLPTAILLGRILSLRIKGPLEERGPSMRDQSAAASTAA
jgi:hypothetical protein